VKTIKAICPCNNNTDTLITKSMWIAIWHGVCLRGINIFIMLHNSHCCNTPERSFNKPRCLSCSSVCVCVRYKLGAWQPPIPGETHLTKCFTPSHTHPHTRRHTYSRHALNLLLFEITAHSEIYFSCLWVSTTISRHFVNDCELCIYMLLSVDNSHLCNNHHRHKSPWMCHC